MGVSLQKVCQQVFSTFYMRFLPLMFELLILLNWKMPCCKSVQLLFFKYLQFMYFHKIFFLNSELGALFTLPKHLDYFFYLTRKCLVVSLFDYYFFKYLHIQDLKKYIKKILCVFLCRILCLVDWTVVVDGFVNLKLHFHYVSMYYSVIININN